MKKPERLSWTLTVNKQGVKMATVNRDGLVEILEYTEYLEKVIEARSPNLIMKDVTGFCTHCNTGFDINEIHVCYQLKQADCPKEYPCPYKDIECDKAGLTTMVSEPPCPTCNHYTGISLRKPETKVLSVGFITSNIESYKSFKYRNTEHKVFIIDNSEAIRGLHFDIIIKGNGWKRVSEVAVREAYSRLIK